MEQNLAMLNEPFPSEVVEKKEGFDYIPHPYVTARLNEVLGVGSWSFVLLETHWIREEDTVVCHGKLTALIDGVWVHKEQWGGQRVNRKRRNADGTPGDIVDISNDYKGAASDALKKCATLLGVGEELMMHPKKPTGQPSGPVVARSVDPRYTQPPQKDASPEQLDAVMLERGRRQEGWATIARVLEGKGLGVLPKEPAAAQKAVLEHLAKLTYVEAGALLQVLLSLPLKGG